MTPTKFVNQNKVSRLLLSLPLLAAISILNGCSGSVSNYSQTPTYGSNVTVSNGTVQSFIITDNANTPVAIGVRASLHAFDNPANIATYPYASITDVPLPSGVVAIPFRSITFFTTAGHDPGPYQVPHYHIAFSQMTWPQRQSIGANLVGLANYDPTKTDANFDLAAPAKYVAPGPPPFQDFHQELPTLGTVYFDPLIPEFNGGAFTTELDYSYYAGVLDSWNLTANRSVLVNDNAGTNIVASANSVHIKQTLKVPAQYQESGYYPTTYSIYYDAGTQSFVFILGDMVYHTAS